MLTDVSETVHIVVTCTNRKTVAPADALKVRSLDRDHPEQRASEWIQRLKRAEGSLVAARDLYCGEHWTVVRSLESDNEDAGRTVQLWVASAGYGLVPIDAEMHPYAATFCRGHADTVAFGASRSDWWQALTMWAGPLANGPRSLAELITTGRGDPILIALSPPYLDACVRDLESGLSHARPGQVSIVSAGKHGGPLGAFLLPCDARLQAALGGSLQALNIRIVSHLLKTHRGPMERKRLADSLQELLVRLPPIVRYNRARTDDDAVARFIKEQLDELGSVSHSRLLRLFRQSGRACEQDRFRSVYESVISRP